MKAWLVTWESANPAAAVERRIAAILPPRWSGRRVGDVLEVLYAQSQYTLGETAQYAKRRSANPYPAHENDSPIHCGHDPYLLARIVTDLEVVSDFDDDSETITWREPDRYRVGPTGPPEIASRGSARSCTQRMPWSETIGNPPDRVPDA